MYFFYFLLLIFVYLLIKNYIARKKIIIGLIFFVSIYLIIVGGWVVRNKIQLNSFKVTDRGGIVLYARSEIDRLSWSEYGASFLRWTPNKYINTKMIANIFGKKPYKPGGVLEGLDSWKKPGRKLRQELASKYSDMSNAKSLADGELSSLAVKRISHTPIRHLAWTLPIIWKGSFVERGVLGDIEIYNIIASIIYIFSMLYLFITSIKKKIFAISLFLLPSIFIFLFQSFFTHNIPRYNIALIPVLIISFILIIYDRLNKDNLKSICQKSRS
jgi:hypothetical protein